MKLLPPPEILDQPPFGSLRFGASVALSGDRLAVGAPVTWREGRVFLYARSGGTWSRVAELEASDPSQWAGFGAAVALRGTHLLVGAPDAVEGTRRGAVYSFEEIAGVWTFQKKIGLGFADGLGTSLGAVAFHALLRADEPRVPPSVGRPGSQLAPLSPKPGHVRAKARSCIFLMMEGGPSHIDTFDPKPKLADLHLQEFVREGKMKSAMESGKRSGRLGFRQKSGDLWDSIPVFGAIYRELCTHTVSTRDI